MKPHLRELWAVAQNLGVADSSLPALLPLDGFVAWVSTTIGSTNGVVLGFPVMADYILHTRKYGCECHVWWNAGRQWSSGGVFRAAYNESMGVLTAAFNLSMRSCGSFPSYE